MGRLIVVSHISESPMSMQAGYGKPRNRALALGAFLVAGVGVRILGRRKEGLSPGLGGMVGGPRARRKRARAPVAARRRARCLPAPALRRPRPAPRGPRRQPARRAARHGTSGPRARPGPGTPAHRSPIGTEHSCSASAGGRNTSTARPERSSTGPAAVRRSPALAEHRPPCRTPQPVAALCFCSRVRCCGGCAQRIRAETAGARARRRRRADHWRAAAAWLAGWTGWC